MTASTPVASLLEDVFIGRQPIFDRKLEIAAYELLYRRGMVPSAEIAGGDQATLEVILNAFVDIGLDAVTDHRPAFLNLTRAFLTGQHDLPFSPQQAVLEVLEDVTIDDTLVDSLRKLKNKGFRIALDDFVYSERAVPLLELADYVKLELPAIPPQALSRQVEQLRRYPVRLLAEKVETREDFEHCLKLGIDYFQGYFLSRPTVIQGQRVPPNRLVLLRLLAALQQPQAGIDEIEALIRQDLVLSYKLLKVINSPFYGLRTRVHSLRQATVLLGLRNVRAWASLIALAGQGDKPQALVQTAMIRARHCELLALAVQDPTPETFFTVGLFSLLDALLDLPLPDILAQLPLDGVVLAALLEHRGAAGAALRCAQAYENADWDGVGFAPLSPGQIREAYLEAVRWAQCASATLLT